MTDSRRSITNNMMLYAQSWLVLYWFIIMYLLRKNLLHFLHMFPWWKIQTVTLMAHFAFSNDLQPMKSLENVQTLVFSGRIKRHVWNGCRLLEGWTQLCRRTSEVFNKYSQNKTLQKDQRGSLHGITTENTVACKVFCFSHSWKQQGKIKAQVSFTKPHFRSLSAKVTLLFCDASFCRYLHP